MLITPLCVESLLRVIISGLDISEAVGHVLPVVKYASIICGTDVDVGVHV